MASAGRAEGAAGRRPPTETRPVTRLRAAPKSELTRAVRPAPMRPAIPSTSPWRTSKETSRSTMRPGFSGSSTDQPRDLQQGGALAACGGRG